MGKDLGLFLYKEHGTSFNVVCATAMIKHLCTWPNESVRPLGQEEQGRHKGQAVADGAANLVPSVDTRTELALRDRLIAVSTGPLAISPWY